MHRAILILFACAIMSASCGTASAQEKPQQQQPKTKMEAFEAQAGSVIIRGFSEAGQIRGALGGVLTVQSIEFTNAATAKKEYGITIEVKETDRLERSNRSFIDYDEIDGLLKGLDYIGKVDKTVTRLDSFQADYKTKGDLRISTFSTGKDTMASVQSGTVGSTSLFLRMPELTKFRELIVSAKAKLDGVKGS